MAKLVEAGSGSAKYELLIYCYLLRHSIGANKGTALCLLNIGRHLLKYILAKALLCHSLLV